MSVEKPQSFDFLGKGLVYNADELAKYDIEYFYGCGKGICKIIIKKNIASSEYFYGLNNNLEWKHSDEKCNKAKLLIKAEWVHVNVPKMREIANNVLDEEAIIEFGHRYVEAPPILELQEDEKIKDNDGRVLNIEVRGDRTVNGCYFKASDVARELQMDNLKTTMHHKDKGYEPGKHYKTKQIARIPIKSLIHGPGWYY
eukprot:765562-Hanusia_phi.AAC.2